MSTIQLRELAYARSGDKGDVCNIGLLAFTRENYALIRQYVTPERIKAHFGDGSKWGVKIDYVHESEPLGTAGALGLLPKDIINEPIFVMNGDLLTDVDFMS